MKMQWRVIFIVVLTVFVCTSVFLSFNAISRPTYEYSEQTDVGGTGVNGWVFEGFNGNPKTADVRVYHPMVKNSLRITADDSSYVEDKSRSVVGIDKFTFVSDENMQVCYIGPNVAYIDEQAFFGCFALKAIIVDEANPYFTDIEGVLYKKDLSEIILYPTNHVNYLKEIGKVSEDYYETNPETYDIPEGVRRIATGCFYKTWGIKEITLPSTLEEIGDMAFFKCQEVQMIVLPDGLKKIGDDSFSYCSKMRGAIYIPTSVESIGHHCFYKCDGLEVFYLGAASQDDIKLGGRWQPKEENKFSAEAPFFRKTRAQADEYNKSLEPISEAASEN